MFNCFERTAVLFYTAAAPFFIPMNDCTRIPISFPNLHQYLLFCFSERVPILVSVRWFLIWFWFVFLMTNDGRGWDGWMASLTQWTWVWVNSKSWPWTGRLGVLQSMGLSQTWQSDWTEPTEWLMLLSIFPCVYWPLIYLLWKNACFSCLSIFKLGCFCLLLLNCRNSWYILSMFALYI